MSSIRPNRWSRFCDWLAGVLSARRSTTRRLRSEQRRRRQADRTTNDLARRERELQYDNDTLRQQVTRLTAEKHGLQEQVDRLDSRRDILEAEIEMLAAWRSRELERLNAEAAQHAIKRGLAQQGIALDDDDEE